MTKPLILIFSSLFILSGCLPFTGDKETRRVVANGLSPKVLYEQAEDKVNAGSIDQAIDQYEIILKSYPGSKYAIQARLDIAYNLFKRKKYDKALINVKSQNRKLSNFDKFIKDGSKYLPFLSEAKYKFSYYVVRTLKTNVESTAERTNLTQFVNKNIITVLAGKWNTCVYEAKKIEKLLS